MSEDTYIVEIEASEPKLPPRVGPFPTRGQAEEWGMRRITNGEWSVAPLVPPVGFTPTPDEDLEREDDEDDYDLCPETARGEAS